MSDSFYSGDSFGVMNMDTVITVNVTMELTCLLVSLCLLLSLLFTRAHRTRLHRILLWMLLVNCGILLADSLAWGLAGRTESYVRPILLVANFLVFALGYLMPIFLAYYLLTYITMRGLTAPKMISRLLPVSAVLMIGLTIASQFTGILYYLDENNLYISGPLSPVSKIFALAYFAIHIIIILHYQKSSRGRDTKVLLLFMVPPILANIIELFCGYIMFVHLSLTVAILMLYAGVQVQGEAQAIRRESELKTAIMLSQIQPHFLYNSLASINELCQENPTAQTAIVTFSKYLRGNMSSLSESAVIPFEKELEHVRQYLSLEKLRFAEKLHVVYDITATDFMLPPLTLQPIVENAVRHGIRKKRGGGTVTIHTAEDGGSYRITVSDDGAGFRQPEGQTGDSHIGIANVRGRLSALCNGELTVTGIPGEGTVAVITIPKGEVKHEHHRR